MLSIEIFLMKATLVYENQFMQIGVVWESEKISLKNKKPGSLVILIKNNFLFSCLLTMMFLRQKISL